VYWRVSYAAPMASAAITGTDPQEVTPPQISAVNPSEQGVERCSSKDPGSSPAQHDLPSRGDAEM
jgi:hypothetical protein